MTSPLRKTGLDLVGGLPWGAHFCHFYETEADILGTLAAYFRAGVEDGELCLWIVGDPIAQKAAEKARRGLVPPLDRYLAEGRLEIQFATGWHLNADEPSAARLLQRWDEKLAWALGHGFSGLRVDGGWVGNSPWRDFMALEKRLSEGIAGKPIIVLCSYPLAGSGAIDVLDVAQMHELALAKRAGRWEVLETPELREAKDEIRRLNDQLQARVDERTAQLAAANAELRDRNRRQSALAAIGLTAIRARDTGALLEEAARVAAATLDAQFSSVLELLAAEGQLVLRAGVGWPAEMIGKRFSVRGPGGHVVRTDAPVIVPDVERDSRFADAKIFAEQGIRSLLGVAIRGRDRPWGALAAHSTSPQAFGDDDVEFLQSLANVVALAVERYEAELAEAESQVRFSKVFHVSPVALAISAIDDGRIIDVNQAWLDLFGYDRAEVIGRNGPDLDLLVDPEISQRKVAPLISQGLVHSLEFQVRRKSGEVRDIIASAARTDFAAAQAWIAALIDITERKRAEADRDRLLGTLERARERLEQLSRRLLTAQEEERRRLAVELHDQLGQVLTAIKIQLESAQRTVPAAVAGELANAVAGVESALQTVHDLALDLRPAVLDDLGLPAALRWFADRFARGLRLQVHVAVDVEAELPLDRDLQTACFRIAQEALTNVARHARAKNVWIELRPEGGALLLSIRDDGVGFDAAAATRRAIGGSSLGLLGMEERASLLGGTFEVASSPGGGTAVRARLPLDGPRRGEE